MRAAGYYIFAAFAWSVSLLPLRVLYLFSYPLYFIFQVFPGYRKKLVIRNLRNAFPEKPEKELKRISSRFYMHLADMFVEGIKLRHMPLKELQERYRFTNPDLLNQYCSEGRDGIAAFGHFGNWEWITAAHTVLEYRVLTVYKPLHNRYFDQWFHRVRSRHGMDIIPMASILRHIISLRREGVRTLTGLVADQTPPKSEIQYWTTFLNQETPVYLGVEKLATKFDMAVFFLAVRKIKRGWYEIDAELLTDNPGSLKEYELTELHTRRLEQIINENPEYWLWSHRRWKHKRKTEDS